MQKTGYTEYIVVEFTFVKLQLSKASHFLLTLYLAERFRHTSCVAASVCAWKFELKNVCL